MNNNEFKEWMKDIECLSERTISRYVGAINKISYHFGENLFDVDNLETIIKMRDIYFSIAENNYMDKKGNRMYSAAVNKYITFLQSNVNNNNVGIKSRFNLKDTTIEEIGNISINDDSDNLLNIVDLRKKIKLLKDRRVRHEKIVKNIATLLDKLGYKLSKGNIDCLAIKDNTAIIVEVKTLDGSISDEIKQVRAAHGQLDYYAEYIEDKYMVYKLAIFESKISEEHIQFLHKFNKLVLWMDNENIYASDYTLSILNDISIITNNINKI